MAPEIFFRCIAMYSDTITTLMSSCSLCNRHCHINRNITAGYCGQTAALRAARAALHFWEEPCISGKNGSGAVFFSGCGLRCVYCQNHKIALDSPKTAPALSAGSGKTISIERLAEIFLELQEKGAHNINLVTPTHFIPQIISALTLAKRQGMTLPVVYNTGSYETVEALKMLDGLIDIYLPDLKYCSAKLSARYSDAPDYFSCACDAIAEMFRQVGTPRFCPDKFADAENESESRLMKKGVIVRHLALPGSVEDSEKVLEYLYHTYGNSIYVSIMSQYTPMPFLFSDSQNKTASSRSSQYPELTRRISRKEYDRLIDFAISLGMENAFIQERTVAKESFIPAFDMEGI